MINRKRGKRLGTWFALTFAAGTLLSLAACRSGGAARSTRPGEAATLVDLNDVKALQERFNQDEGTSRLLLVLSPT